MWTSSWIRWAVILGFALGGFFDGILLHQILQWHHLLSLVPGMDDLRLQVLWDGYFHMLMYVVALVGLLGLWRAWRRGALAAGRPLAGAILVGFGLWHSIDALLSHWLLGIHRIRIDSPDPLLWDLAWLVVFGIAPLLVGDDPDAPALLEAALALATHRVVVKRPRKAPCIEGPKPSHALDGKSSRYDIYPKKALKP